MTALYFAEKQLRRYPWRSAAYSTVCFFFAVILVLFGTMTFSMIQAKSTFFIENELDCVSISVSATGATQEKLLERKYVEQVSNVYSSKHAMGVILSNEYGESGLINIDVFRYEKSLPKREVQVYEKENGTSPILFGRDIQTEGEMILDESVLSELGLKNKEYSRILGATFISRYYDALMNEYKDIESWTIVGVSEASFKKNVLFEHSDEMKIAFVRVSAMKSPTLYNVYSESGMLGAVYRSLLSEYGKNNVALLRRSADVQEKFSEYVAFFNRVFLFLLILLCISFLGVTVFAVVFYTSKQSEFQMIASAFGARKGALFLSQTLCYALLLLPAVLLSILTSALLQGAFLDVLGGYLGATLVRVSVGMLFAVGGMIFGVLALCVAAGVVIGTVAVQKRNL